jgi:hypothetical protein
MLIEEITLDFDTLLEKRVWAKSGNKVIRKTRCMSGPRKGRVVSDPAQCSKPKNMKKSRTMKKTRASKGFRMAKKARKTKRFNPASKRVQRLNRSS